MLDILDAQYNHLWLHLQAMPLPRPDQFATDLARIVAKVGSNGDLGAAIDLERLEELIRAGLE
jgi:hypothetical protein